MLRRFQLVLAYDTRQTLLWHDKPAMAMTPRCITDTLVTVRLVVLGDNALETYSMVGALGTSKLLHLLDVSKKG
jgi:hypothetical protein